MGSGISALGDMSWYELPVYGLSETIYAPGLSQIPEPATLYLLITGTVFAIGFRKRFKR